jgi:ATP adenylyltransferase
MAGVPDRNRKKKSTAGSLRGKNLQLAIGENIWPTERDVLFRPDRLKYVRKLIKTDGCVFCHAAKAKIGFSSLVLFRTKLSMVVLNKYPYNPGHILILPNRHIGDLLALSDVEYTDLQETFRLAFRRVQEAYHPSGLNMGLNQGAVAGAGIPGHLHYHIVPRWAGDLNFFPLLAETKALPTDLETSFKTLHRSFQS